MKSGIVGRFAGGSRNSGSKVPEWNVYYPTLEPTPLTPGATKEQKAFFAFWKANFERGKFVDVDGNLGYLFVYENELLHRFAGDKDIDSLVASFERLNKGYSNYEKFVHHLNFDLTNAYLFVKDYDAAWQLRRKESFLSVNDVLNIRAKCRETSIDGSDLLEMWGASTEFGRTHQAQIVNLATAKLADFHRKHGMNCIEHFSRQFDLDRVTQDDLDRLESYFPKGNAWARKEFERLKGEWQRHPKSKITEIAFFWGAIASVELPKVVERALRYEIQKTLRECEDTVKKECTLKKLLCPSCGQAASQDANFCRQCGKPLIGASRVVEFDGEIVVCPYCNAPLTSFPKSKKKCPSCKKTILIRLRSKAKKLVTEAQAQEIDCERAIKSETYGLDELALTQFETLKKTAGSISQKDLLKALRDIKWQMYNRDLEYCAKANWKSYRIFQPRRWNEDVHLRERGSWDSYRTVRFKMGEQLRKESKFAEALPIYLEVFYLDINGTEPDFKGVWRPELGYATSDIVKEIQRIVKKLALSRSEINEIFIYNERVQARLKLPVPASQAWSKLENEVVFK